MKTAALYLGCLAVIIYIRLGLTFRRFDRMAALSQAAGATAPFSGLSPGQVARAIRRASRIVPGASCLTQALSTKYLLGKTGRPSSVFIGVRKIEDRMQAHAWCICENRVVSGADGYDILTYNVIKRIE